MGVNPFLGFVSNLGVLVWCASAAVCLFSWAVLRNRVDARIFASFVFYAGLLSALLLVDDFFELHELVFPKYLHVPETFTYACYGFLAVALLFTFSRLHFEDRLFHSPSLIRFPGLVNAVGRIPGTV